MTSRSSTQAAARDPGVNVNMSRNSVRCSVEPVTDASSSGKVVEDASVFTHDPIIIDSDNMSDIDHHCGRLDVGPGLVLTLFQMGPG